MKRLSTIFLGLAILFFSLAGCEDDPTLTTLKKVEFNSTASVSASQLVLTEADSTTTVITLNWPAVDYYIDAPVTYSLQITTPEDTTDWGSAYEVEVGNDILTCVLTGRELNNIATTLGIETETQGNLVFRVKSYVDRVAFSQAMTVGVTTYKEFSGYPALWVPGDYQGWNPATAPTIVSVNEDGVYEGYIYIPEGVSLQFKLTAQPDWEPMAYGDGGDGVLIEANFSGGNFTALSAGYYFVAADLNNMTYLLIKTTWGIIGGATPGGWDSDTQLTYNAGSQTWSVTADMKADGSFKFRANNAWQMDFGIDAEGNLAYANHPWLTYVEGPQLTVPEDGNYTITLDLHNSGNYTYKIKKN